MHKLCEKCERSSLCKLGTYEFMNHVLDSGCDGFHKKGKSKDKGKANPSAYHIGYAEGQRDAEQIKNTHLLQRATSAEALLTATENKAAEYKSWAAKAVKEGDELRAKIAELEAEKQNILDRLKHIASDSVITHGFFQSKGCPVCSDLVIRLGEKHHEKCELNKLIKDLEENSK